MAIYKIVEDGDEILREKAKPVPQINSNIIKLIKNMSDTMYANKGVGLAAPQIGVSKRVIVIDVGEGLIELINPEIIQASGKDTDMEGCLSLPELTGEVTRAAEVSVKGLNKQGQEVSYKAKGYLARAFQHEIDHLDGILFTDLATRIRKIKQ